MNPTRTTHINSIPAPSAPSKQPPPSRRQFLKAAALGAAGLAVAASGCLIMPPAFEAINSAAKTRFQAGLLNAGYKPLIVSPAPELGEYVDFIVKNAGLLQPEERQRANELVREWISLSDFIKPCFPTYCQTEESNIRENIKSLINTSAGSGSGTLITSEGHILTAAHVVEALGASPFSKMTIAGDLDVAIGKLSEAGPEIQYYPHAFAKLATPASGASVMIYGFPANSGGPLGGLQEVRSTVALHDSLFGVMDILPLSQAISGSGYADFESYGEHGANLHGASGGPVTTQDGRILGVVSRGLTKGEEGAPFNSITAMDAGCIKETVFRYINEYLTGPLQELAIRINSRLG